jgi:hypothetical protein
VAFWQLWCKRGRKRVVMFAKKLLRAEKCRAEDHFQSIPPSSTESAIDYYENRSIVLTKFENAPDQTTVIRALTDIQSDKKITSTTL